MARPALAASTLIAGAALLAGCDTGPMEPERAAALCEQRAREAQGPTGAVAVGASSHDGPFVSGALVLSSGYLSGRDPYDVYDSCVIRYTGAPPVRPPALYR